ncbi:hypothetical protein CANTEDRAFT_112368 [Yamadazyma tenuis ATCC 10573]|uniref:Uncharacterized protein n=1 Tax=Candida tenuis (strain ATCC 10573 / BCRC 21748 / CBS 615 / JCM 9827 / NBRC 10315 / NRRL Y-1498 / VKM Y-70) TaxID=590646 RepID=G3AWZ2_CANTC|nr:uncharacterized protein CANTEDRAFT_112368 [Yamadazyma tenuis ATCC 10573]EGV66647.1 hypothetical protein CANTEDRAFT_112368 [Yamadazyma tenuis ATCC 10573]
MITWAARETFHVGVGRKEAPVTQGAGGAVVVGADCRGCGEQSSAVEVDVAGAED